MSELRTHQDGIRAGEEAIRTYSKQREELRTEQGVVRQSLAEVHEKLKTARQDLVFGYLSGVDRESVDRASVELGMMSLPLEQFGQEQEQRQAENAGSEGATVHVRVLQRAGGRKKSSGYSP